MAISSNELSIQQFVDLLTQPPASFVWSQGEGRTIGTAPGAIVDIWPAHVEAALLFPPDDAALVVHNATLLLLILTALRPDWAGAAMWLKTQMGMAARAKLRHEGAQYGRGVWCTWERQHSRALLRVTR